MCGIAGIIGNFDKTTGVVLIKKMLREIEHRGPDSMGLWSTHNFVFGMQRLSIIDLTGGDQPIWSPDGNVGIIFNGEIYNFKHLRSTLESEGIVFHTHSDTEVILHLYLKKGLDAIHDLEGMFGICLYDSQKQTVYLIRDRLGVKPLYYYHDDTTFIFGSEIKSLLTVLPQKPSVNHQSIWDYLTLRYVPAPETIWENIYKLEPGCYLKYDLNTQKFLIKQYWMFNFYSEKISKTRNYEKEFETLFLEAVEKRLLASDVPVGILLSGGLDSSCLAAAALELGHKNFHTFSIGFDEGGKYNELKYAQQVSNHIGSIHHETIINQNQFMDFLEKFTWYSDEPIADLASVPLYYVSKLASSHVKVALSGEGSDEILAGYNLDQLAKKLFYLKLLNYLPKFFLTLLPKNSLKRLAQYGYTDFLKSSPFHITNIFSEMEKEKICSFQATNSTNDYLKNLYALSSSPEPLDQLQQCYCSSWLVEDLLMKADKMSMANSLEIRVPFLDHKLVEWASTLPLEWKIGSLNKGFTTKRILRQFAQKRLPREIIDRPKEGFPVPAYEWIKSKEMLQWISATLSQTSFQKWICPKELSNLMIQLQTPSLETTHKVWSLLVLSLWFKRWLG